MSRPGTVLRLVRDVVNPNPDRRQKYDWRADALWSAGTRFRVVRHGDPGGAWVLVCGFRWNTLQRLAVGCIQARAIIAAAEDVAPTTQEAFSFAGIEYTEILGHLVDIGRLSIEELVSLEETLGMRGCDEGVRS